MRALVRRVERAIARLGEEGSGSDPSSADALLQLIETEGIQEVRLEGPPQDPGLVDVPLGALIEALRCLDRLDAPLDDAWEARRHGLATRFAALRFVSGALVPLVLGVTDRVEGVVVPVEFRQGLTEDVVLEATEPQSLEQVAHTVLVRLGWRPGDAEYDAVLEQVRRHREHWMWVPLAGDHASDGGRMVALVVRVETTETDTDVASPDAEHDGDFRVGCQQGVEAARAWLAVWAQQELAAFRVTIAVHGLARRQRLKGGSAALAVALAVVGEVLGVAPPEPWAATGTLRQEGGTTWSIGAVEDLDHKRPAFLRSAVPRLLVPRVGGGQATPRLVPVRTLDEAVRLVLGAPETLAAQRSPRIRARDAPAPSHAPPWRRALDHDTHQHFAMALPGAPWDAQVRRELQCLQSGLYCDLRGVPASSLQSAFMSRLTRALYEQLDPAPVPGRGPLRMLALWLDLARRAGPEASPGMVRVVVEVDTPPELRTLRRVARQLLVPHGVQVVLVAPGLVWRRLTPRRVPIGSNPSLWKIREPPPTFWVAAALLALLALVAGTLFSLRAPTDVDAVHAEIAARMAPRQPGVPPESHDELRADVRNMVRLAEEGWFRPDLAA